MPRRTPSSRRVVKDCKGQRMTERTTLARPYAEAVFRLASEHKALKPWSEMLQLAVAVMQDPQVAALAENPRVPRAHSSSFFSMSVQAARQGWRNFIRLLSENHRLPLLPENRRTLRSAARGRREPNRGRGDFGLRSKRDPA